MPKTLKDKRMTYIRVFENEAGKEVLSDLRAFCFATKTTAVKGDDKRIDPYEMMRYEGRREVFLQIMNLLKVDFEEYYNYEEDL